MLLKIIAVFVIILDIMGGVAEVTTTLMVQTDRILNNLKILQKQIDGAALIPILSANAYGLGDVTVAKLLYDKGLSFFAVARLEDAERLLANLAGINVLLLTPYATEQEISRIVERDIIATVGSNDGAMMLSGIAGKLSRKARCHLRFDVGSGGSGYLPTEAPNAGQTIKYMENLMVTGVYATLSKDGKEKRIKQQYTEFMGVLSDLSKEGIDYGAAHLSSTGAALKFPWARLDAVRIGEGLAGAIPIRDKWGFKKVGRLVSPISDIRWVPKGRRVGDDSIKTSKATKLASIPVGYSDGLFTDRISSKTGLFRRRFYCEIQGKKVPVIGNPGFTTTLVDVTNIDCSPGTQVSFEVNPCYVTGSIRREYV